VLDGPARQALTGLARSPRFGVWVISGRRRADIRARVRVRGIRYLGLHGWEDRRSATLTKETRDQLAGISAVIPGLLAESAGVWIEDKVHALSVHYVAWPTARRAARAASWKKAMAPFSRSFRLRPGKKVWEIVPHELEDKGIAVRRELAALPGRALPVYVGDDEVDEDAFAVLAKGVTIRVGRGGVSRARYCLPGVAQVRVFLQKLRTESHDNGHSAFQFVTASYLTRVETSGP